MPTFTETPVGTQQRGAAVGTLRSFDADDWTSTLVAGTDIGTLDIGDMLSVSLYLHVQAAAPGNIDGYDIKVSMDNQVFTSLFGGTTATKFESLKNAIVAGAGLIFLCEIQGNKHRYIKVIARATVNATPVKLHAIGSLFTAQPTSIVDQASMLGYKRRLATRIIQSETQASPAVNSTTEPSTTAHGVDIAGFETVVADVHITGGTVDFSIWAHIDGGGNTDWNRIDGFPRAALGKNWIQAIDARGIDRLCLVKEGGAGTVSSFKAHKVG